MGSALNCSIHGGQGCQFVSPGVIHAIEENKSSDIVYILLLLEGELEKEIKKGAEEGGGKEFDEEFEKEFREELRILLYTLRSFYVKKEELGIFPLTGNLSKKENKYEYIMIFEDEHYLDKARSTFRAVCTKCFAEFVSDNPEIIYPYWVEDIPESW